MDYNKPLKKLKNSVKPRNRDKAVFKNAA